MSSKNNPDNRNKKDNNKKLCPCGGEMRVVKYYAKGIHGQMVWSCDKCEHTEGK